MIDIYQPKTARIVSVHRESVDTARLRLVLAARGAQKKFSFRAGQFMQIGLAGWGECPISICSSPSDSAQFFELAIRDVGQLTHRLNALRRGAEVSVRGPFGSDFDYNRFYNRPLALIGGGCGFVPLRPIINDQIDGIIQAASLKIFYGCQDEQTILFSGEHKKWRDRSELNIILAQPSKKWRGPRGLITDLIKPAKLSADSVCVLVGPPIMYRFVIPLLMKKKIRPENIIVSLERKMYCGHGVCQHCAIGPYYVCKDGPVFTYKQLMGIKDAI